MAETIVKLQRVALIPRPPEFLPSDAATAARFDASTARLGQAMGLTRLGCNVTQVAPGKAAYPFHSHRGNDELFLVLAGQGELRLGGQRLPVTEGDLIACPAGDASSAHQLINTGTAALRYLAVSSTLDPEICEYPDSGKVGAYSGKGSDGFYHLSRGADAVDYWLGEDQAAAASTSRDAA